MTDTPRTDEQEIQSIGWPNILEFCRQLERELADASKAHGEAAKFAAQMDHENAALRADLEVAQEELVHQLLVLAELSRGEFICQKCGLRKDGETSAQKDW